MCPIAGGNWNNGVNAGVWALSCNDARTSANSNVGFRALCKRPFKRPATL